jgi:uncharacterized protein YjbI with pentapeptide repeats
MFVCQGKQVAQVTGSESLQTLEGATESMQNLQGATESLQNLQGATESLQNLQGATATPCHPPAYASARG